jgi:hypothetical protein
MRETNELPDRLRARLARALDAVPELRPRAEQATYAAVGRRGPRRRPALALASAVAALAALTALIGVASTGTADPAVWPSRALSAIQLARPSTSQPSPDATPSPAAPGSAAGARYPAPTAPAAARRSPGSGEGPRPTLPPGLAPLPTYGLPRFSPPPFPSGYPFPTPSGTSDFGHGGR